MKLGRKPNVISGLKAKSTGVIWVTPHCMNWYRRYWSAYCRFRHLEHLHGDRPWREFSPGIFGDLLALKKKQDPLLDEILNRVYDGQENLDIINWAIDCQLNMERIHTILSALDVNRSRLKLAVA